MCQTPVINIATLIAYRVLTVRHGDSVYMCPSEAWDLYSATYGRIVVAPRVTDVTHVFLPYAWEAPRGGVERDVIDWDYMIAAASMDAIVAIPASTFEYLVPLRPATPMAWSRYGERRVGAVFTMQLLRQHGRIETL